MRTLVSTLAVVLSVLVAVPQVSAQTSHAAPQAALDAALQQHVSASASDRADVLRVLDAPEVKAVAGELGVDLRQAASAVATLQGQQLAQVAAQARDVQQSLAGGQSRVVINTTLLIVALLVLILVIVAVK